MNKYRLNIDGKEVYGLPGQTILRCLQRERYFSFLLFAMMREQKFTAHADFVW